MSYKIAIASSDGEKVDLSFGEAERFIIYEAEGKEFKKIEERIWDNEDFQSGDGCDSKENCGGNGGGCGGGCSNAGGNIPKIKIVEDCRCIVCKKIGFKVRKQLEKKAVSAFDIEYPISEALEKITFYFDRVDNHQSLRGTASR